MTSISMSSERWQRLTQIVNDCLELPANTRDAHARALCADDQALHDEAMRWINEAEQTQGFLDEAASFEALTLRPDAGDISRRAESALEWTGKRLGPYRITEEIARGGMGSVFKAVRADDAYQQTVAIKVVRSHVATELIAQRFRAERQILANLEHPHIARLIDGGQSDDGTPYLVMEYIDGKPIDAYCDSCGLSVDDRLKLFRDVCSAVQYAHQRLIVHRDLKPSNILVDKAGQVKLLDFGIAKLLDSAQLDEHGNAVAMPTEANAMTPAYASPEQVKGEAITTASDVYALGVLLYRLLTGRSPYKSPNTQPLALAQEIVETNPERPSTVVTQPESSRPTELTVDANEIKNNFRTLDSKRLQKELRGDLDNVILMALRKDPQRRYASAEQFSEDVKRCLAHMPVSARTDTFKYRATKFVSRNRWTVSLSALTGVGLVCALGVALHQTSVAREAQIRAEQNFSSVRALANTYLFDLHKSLQALPGTASIQEKLVSTATRYLHDLQNGAGNNPDLLAEVGGGFHRLASIQGGATSVNVGQTGEAEKNFHQAIKLLTRAHEAAPTSVVHALSLIKAKSDFSIQQGKQKHVESSIRLYREATQLATDLEKRFPSNIDVKLRRFVLLANKPALNLMLGTDNSADAAALEFNLGSMQELRASELSNEQRDTLQSILARTYGSLAIADEQTKGRPPGATKRHLYWRLEALKLQRDIVAQKPADPSVATALIYAILFAAEALAVDSQLEDVKTLSSEALARSEALVKSDPDNEAAKVTLLQSYSRVAYMILNKEQYEEARRLSGRALEGFKLLNDGTRTTYESRQSYLVSLAIYAAAAAVGSQSAANSSDKANQCTKAKQNHDEVRRIAKADPALLGGDDAFLRVVATHIAKCD
jgi:eukaryotic-like serine/threonine-protein kinase